MAAVFLMFIVIGQDAVWHGESISGNEDHSDEVSIIIVIVVSLSLWQDRLSFLV